MSELDPKKGIKARPAVFGIRLDRDAVIDVKRMVVAVVAIVLVTVTRSVIWVVDGDRFPNRIPYGFVSYSRWGIV